MMTKCLLWTKTSHQSNNRLNHAGLEGVEVDVDVDGVEGGVFVEEGKSVVVAGLDNGPPNFSKAADLDNPVILMRRSNAVSIFFIKLFQLETAVSTFSL